jgi:hypothetical protein
MGLEKALWIDGGKTPRLGAGGVSVKVYS